MHTSFPSDGYRQDASPAQEATDAKEADAKEAEPKPKSKSNGPAKNTKKDPEPTKKGSAQGKAAPGSERAKSIDQAKESQTKSKAEKNTKSSKPKGKNELEKAPEVIHYNKSLYHGRILFLCSSVGGRFVYVYKHAYLLVSTVNLPFINRTTSLKRAQSRRSLLSSLNRRSTAQPFFQRLPNSVN